MKLKPRFWGSSAARVLGILGMISYLAYPNPQTFSTAIAGVVTVIGSLICRSAKKAKLGLAKSSTARNLTEALGVAAIVAIVGLQRDLLGLMYREPFANLIIPLWALVAYAVAKFGEPQTTSQKTSGHSLV